MIHPLSALDAKNKVVLVRTGFDVPIKDGVLLDTTRIEATIPTLKAILAQGGAIVIVSHQGRPEGKDMKYSQALLQPILSSLLECPVQFVADVISEEAQLAKKNLKPGQVLLLENVRFYAEETSKNTNDRTEFAQKLAMHCDAFVNEAFTNCHRAHASVTEITKFLPSYAGLQLEKEYTYLQDIFAKKRPIVFIVAGAKLETKVPVIEAFLGKGDTIIVGGLIASSFLAAQHVQLGSSYIDPESIVLAQRLLLLAEQKGTKIRLPIDAACSDSMSGSSVSYTDFPLPETEAMFDIGEKTILLYKADIKAANTIIWNGPVGVYEQERFATGSKAIAHAMIEATNRGATTIVGGGDTLDFWQKYSLPVHECTFASTGGGAMLEMISGAPMPALIALDW